MGNSTGKEELNLDYFITHYEISSLEENEVKCLIILGKLYKIFEENPNVYQEYKENQDKLSQKKNIMSNLKKEEIDIESLNNPNIYISKPVKYQLMIANLFIKKFKDIRIYFMLIKLIKFILKETDFFKIFTKNCLEQINNLLSNPSIEDIFVIEACELLILVIEQFKTDFTVLINQLTNLNKIFDIPKKIKEGDIVQNYKLSIALSKLLEKCISLLIYMQNKSKFFKYETKKELNDFIKKIVGSEYGGNTFFYQFLVDSLTTELIENNIDTIKPFDVKEDLMNSFRKSRKKFEVKNKINEDKEESDNSDDYKYIHELTKKINAYYDDYYKDLKDVETYPFIVLNIFGELSKLNVIFLEKMKNQDEKIINPEKEIKGLLNILLLNKKLLTLEEYKNPQEEYQNNFKVRYYIKLSIKILGIIITYYVLYCISGNLKDGFFIDDFNPNVNEVKFNKSISELFHIFEQSIEPNIRFLICSFFLALGYNRQVWQLFLELNVVNHPKSYIIHFIKDTFDKSYDIENKDEQIYQERINSILKFIEVGLFLTNEKIYYSIKHTDIFKNYLEPYLLLFYINCPNYRGDIVRILNIFTLYDDCKLIILEPKNKIVREKIFKRLDELFEDLQKGNEMVEDLDKQRREINKKKELTFDDFKTQLSFNEDLLSKLENYAKQNFIATGREFCYLVSIFTNLMMTNRFETNLNILCNEDIDKLFLYNENTNINLFQKKKSSTSDNSDNNKGRLLIYHDFFLSLNVLKSELVKIQINDKSFSKYIFQLPLAMVMYNPGLKIYFTKGDRTENPKLGDQNLNLNYLIDLISLNKNDHQITHKLIFTCYRFYCNNRFIYTKQFNDTLMDLLPQKHLQDIPLFLVREIFRFFITLTSGGNNLLLWLKLESNLRNLINDFSNNNDIILRYMNDELNWGKDKNNLFSTNQEKTIGGITNITKIEDQAYTGKVIILPYRNIKQYNDKYGIITYNQQQFILSKPIDLIQDNNSFTIFFRFYNPIIKTGQWHTLIQDESGIMSLISIDKNGKRIGCFGINGEFLDSGIDLENEDLKNQWLQISFVFKAVNNNKDSNSVIGEVQWYLNGILRQGTKNIIKGNKVVSQNNNNLEIHRKIMYIGNSRDYNEPFGAFCDLRIYKEEKIDFDEDEDDEDVIKLLLDSTDRIVEYIKITKYLSYEVLYFIVKFFNNMIVSKHNSQRERRNQEHDVSKYLNFQVVMKLCEEGFSYTDKEELKKELSKYLKLLT